MRVFVLFLTKLNTYLVLEKADVLQLHLKQSKTSNNFTFNAWIVQNTFSRSRFNTGDHCKGKLEFLLTLTFHGAFVLVLCTRRHVLQESWCGQIISWKSCVYVRMFCNIQFYYSVDRIGHELFAPIRRRLCWVQAAIINLGQCVSIIRVKLPKLQPCRWKSRQNRGTGLDLVCAVC